MGDRFIALLLLTLWVATPAAGTDIDPAGTCIRRTCVGLSREARGLCKRRCRCERTPAPTCSEVTTIRLVHSNDLHAHLTPHLDLVRDDATGEVATSRRVEERGGLARLATLIARLRGERHNTLLVNVGDTYHGGVEALFTNGDAIVDPVNLLGIDVGVPGNWDFAYGPIITRARYADPPPGGAKRPAFPNLGANVTYAIPDPRAGQPFLPPTLVRDIAGVRVGFIGITSDIVPEMHPILAAGLTFLQGEAAYRTLVNTHAAALRSQGAQIVVVLSELGLHKDYRLAQIVDAGVDLFLSAHTHEAVFEPLVARSGALVVEAGNDGYLGRMDVAIVDGMVAGRDWLLQPIGRDLPSDPLVQAAVEAARAPFLAPDVDLVLPNPLIMQRLRQPIDTTIGHTAGSLDRRAALENTFNRAFGALVRRRTGTQVAMATGFRFDSVIAAPGTLLEDDTVTAGAITIEDAYRFFPVPFGIVTGTVTGARLREIIEAELTSVYSFDPRRRCQFRGDPRRAPRVACTPAPGEPAAHPGAFRQRGGWVAGFDGLRLDVDLARPDGARVLGMAVGDSGAAIGDADVLSIAGCRPPLDAGDLLCRYPGFTNVQPFVDPATGRAYTPVDLLVAALADGPLPAVGGRLVTDVSETPAWPEAPFVQPLAAPGFRRTRSR